MSENWIPGMARWTVTSGACQGDLASVPGCARGAVGHHPAGRRQHSLAQRERIAIGAHPAWLLYGIGPSTVKDAAALTMQSADVERTLERQCKNIDIPFRHRVVGVLRPDALPTPSQGDP